MSEPITISQSLQLLAKMREAAPEATAAKLAQMTALIKELASENAYLNARVSEDHTLLKNMDDTPLLAEFVDDQPPVSPDELMLLAGLHDALRPALLAIRQQMEWIEAEMQGLLTDRQEHALQVVTDSSDRSFRLLDAVQRLIDIQRGDTDIEQNTFIASELLEEAHQRAQADHHYVSVQLPEVVPVAQGDYFQSLLILDDLLDNAIRYTPQGGEIRLSLDNLGTHVLFSVADNGIGLRPEDMTHIGEPFWRGEHHPLVHQHRGSGLSLYIAKEVLARQGGELIFSGEPELGSTFSFTLAIPS